MGLKEGVKRNREVGPGSATPSFFLPLADPAAGPPMPAAAAAAGAAAEAAPLDGRDSPLPSDYRQGRPRRRICILRTSGERASRHISESVSGLPAPHRS